MTRKVDQNEAQERLPELIREVASGADIVIRSGDGGEFRLVEVKPASDEDRAWYGLSLAAAMRDVEDNGAEYSIADIRERYP